MRLMIVTCRTSKQLICLHRVGNSLSILSLSIVHETSGLGVNKMDPLVVSTSHWTDFWLNVSIINVRGRVRLNN